MRHCVRSLKRGFFFSLMQVCTYTQVRVLKFGTEAKANELVHRSFVALLAAYLHLNIGSFLTVPKNIWLKICLSMFAHSV